MSISVKGYELKEKIGEGGMARVFSARHIRLERDVALKVLLSRYAEDPDFAERFLREARIAAQLNHPNIVQIYDVDSSDGELYLSMELVSGGDLAQRLKRRREKANAIRAFDQLCAALDYAHDKGYIHRDIKPANILFREDDSLALSDFGIARAMHSDTNMTKTGLVIGTPSYMSPEQAQGHPLNGQADLYSAGVIAFQYVTGQLPYNADSSLSLAIKHISDPIPTLPPPLAKMQAFFNRALAKKPEERFENGKEFAEAFSKSISAIANFEKAQDETIELLTAELSEETVAQAYSGHEQIANSPAAISANAKNRNKGFMSITHATMRIFFIQINKIKVLVSAPQKLRNNIILLLLFFSLLGLGYFAADSELFARKPQLSPGEQVRIAQYLNAADEALREERLTMPAQDNAYEYFLAITALSPDDPIAIDGFEQIITKLSLRAEQQIESGNLELAKRTLAQMQLVDANSSEAEDLKSLIATIETQKTKDLEKGLKQAEEQIESGELDEALSSYQNVIELQGDEKPVDEALTKLATLQFEEASTHAQALRFEEAHDSLANAETAAKLVDDTVLTEKITRLKNEVNQKEGAIARDQHVLQLISQGDSALSSGNLLVPFSKNAWYYYSQALRRDATNKQALAGREKVKELVVNQAHTAIEENRLSDAKTALEGLARIDSRNSNLRNLQNALEKKQRLQNRAKAQELKIAELYKRADRYLEAKRAGSADKIWRQINSLSPNDSGLPALSQKIADGYVELAQREIDGQDWRDVEVWVERGLKHVPNHKKLLEQRAFARAKM